MLKRVALIVSVLVASVLLSQPARAATSGGRTSVIGGGPASISAFPFMARITAREGVYKTTCSGTVVAPNMILTAAHCLLDESHAAYLSPSTFQVLTGTGNVAVPGTVSTVERLVVDPGYEPFGSFAGWHDAGLIQLAEPVSAPAVQIATSQIWGPGTLGYIVGWGLVEGEELPAEMQLGETVVQSQGYCEHAVGVGFHPLAELCSIDYPSYQSATCNGDSGGPMLMVSNQQFVEIGITSFGIAEGCPTDSPRVDTRADVEAAWVSREIAAHPPKITPAPAPPTPPTSTPPTTSPGPKPSPSPAPSVTPELPKLTAGSAKSDVFDLLRTDHRLSGHFRGHVRYDAWCYSTSGTSAQCSARWMVGALRYEGTISVFEEWEGATPVWDYRYWIHRTNEWCISHATDPGRCPRPLFHG